MSGGIHHLTIEFDRINVSFTLDNAPDPTAQKIVGILNTNLPEKVEKLWLMPDQQLNSK
jgi:hypothetical protein